MGKYIFLLACWAILGSTQFATAQDFFDKDFAKAPDLSHDQDTPVAQGDTTDNRSANPLDKQGKKISGLGLIAQGIESQKAMADMDTYARLLSHYKFKPGVIQLLGYTPPIDNVPLLKKARHLAMLGVIVDPEFKLSEKYKVTRSPSWILTLEDGEVVLEGVESPEKFINAKGEFVEPEDYLGIVKEDAGAGSASTAKKF